MSTLAMPVFQPLTATTYNLGDQALRRVLQQVIVGISGLDGSLVRPAWQSDEMPELPPYNVNWAWFRVLSKKSDVYAYEGHVPAQADFTAQTFNQGGFGFSGSFGGNVSQLYSTQAYGETAYGGPEDTSPLVDGFNFVFRHQEIALQITFSGPDSDSLADRFTMGLQLDVNRAAMLQFNIGHIETQGPLSVPTFRNGRRQQGADVTWRLRRSQLFKYAMPSVELANVILYFDNPVDTVTIPVHRLE